MPFLFLLFLSFPAGGCSLLPIFTDWFRGVAPKNEFVQKTAQMVMLRAKDAVKSALEAHPTRLYPALQVARHQLYGPVQLLHHICREQLSGPERLKCHDLANLMHTKDRVSFLELD